MVWITAAEALAVLQVLPQTLYANVSRGKVRARPDDVDPRRSLYHRDDVLRMARRSNGRRKVDAVSAQAMQYGDPVLSTALSTAADGRLLYRGHDAAELAHTATLEDVAALLWGCEPALVYAATAAVSLPAQGLATAPASALAAALLALAQRSASKAAEPGSNAARPACASGQRARYGDVGIDRPATRHARRAANRRTANHQRPPGPCLALRTAPRSAAPHAGPDGGP